MFKKLLLIGLAVILAMVTSGTAISQMCTSADFEGTWFGHELVSGDGPQQEPGWAYRTITIDSNGTATYAGTNHNGQTSSGTKDWQLHITSQGIITDPLKIIPDADETHGVMSDDKKLMVFTQRQVTKDQPALTVYVKREVTSSFRPSDLAGTWRYHGLISGDAPNQTPGWYWGEFTFNQFGALISATPITDSLGNSYYTPSDPGFNINPDGTIMVAGADGRGVMNDGKDIIAGVATMCPGRDTDVCGYNLQIWVKRGMTSFGTADLEGTWYVHYVSSGDSPQWTGWGYGPFTIDSHGNYAGSIQYSDHSTDNPNGTLTVTGDGIITEAADPDTHGVMNANKNLMVFTSNNGLGDYNLFLFTKRIASLQSIPVADISVDGDPSDWDGINPQLVDREGDTTTPEHAGTDISKAYVATNESRDRLYFLIDVVGVPNNEPCPVGDNPDLGLVAYLVAFDDPEIESWGTSHYDWQIGFDNLRFWVWDLRGGNDYDDYSNLTMYWSPEDISAEFSKGSFIEFSMPTHVINIPTDLYIHPYITLHDSENMGWTNTDHIDLDAFLSLEQGNDGAGFAAEINRIYYQDSSGREIDYDFSTGEMDQYGTVAIPASAIKSVPQSEKDTTFLWGPGFGAQQVSLDGGIYSISIPQTTDTITPIPVSDITVDGSVGDWDAIGNHIDDRVGDIEGAPTGADIDYLKLAYSSDSSKLYVLMKLNGSVDQGVWYRLFLDKDLDGEMDEPGDYAIDLQYTGVGWEVVSQGWNSEDGWDWYPVEENGIVAVSGQYIEASVDSAAFGLPAEVNIYGRTMQNISPYGIYDTFSNNFLCADGFCSLWALNAAAPAATQFQFSARTCNFINVSQNQYTYEIAIGTGSFEPEYLLPRIRAIWFTGTYLGMNYDKALVIEVKLENHRGGDDKYLWEWSIDKGLGMVLEGYDPDATFLDLRIAVTEDGQTLSAYYRINSDLEADWELAVTHTLPSGTGTIYGFTESFPYVSLSTGVVQDTNIEPTIEITQPSTDVPVTQGESVTIQWNGTDPDSDAVVSIGYDQDNIFDNGNHTWIEPSQPELGSIPWNTSGVAPGTYYIFGLISDGENSDYDYATGRVTIGQPDIYIEWGHSIDFGGVPVGQSSPTYHVDVINNGPAPLVVGAASVIGSDSSQFPIQSGGGSFTVNPSQYHRMVMVFSPTSAGAKTATLRISSNDPDENPYDITLSGTGVSVPPTIDMTQPSSDVPVTQGQSVTISWNGTDPDSDAVVSIGYDQDNIFDNGNHTWIEPSQPEVGSIPWNTSGVAPGTYYIFGLILDGENSDYDYATGRVTVNPQFAVSSVTARINGGTSPVTVTAGGTITTSGTISGTGSGTVTYHWEYRESGGSPQSLLDKETTMTEGAATIPSQTVNAPAAGTYYYRVVVTSPNNLPSGNEVQVMVEPLPPEIHVSDTFHDFLTVMVEDPPVDWPLTIYNQGTGELTISGLSGLPSSGFSLVNPPSTPFTIAPNGGYRTLTVRFAPTSAGPKTATLSIANNDANKDPTNIELWGTGCQKPGKPSLSVPESEVDSGDRYTVSWDAVDHATRYTLQEVPHEPDFDKATNYPVEDGETSKDFTKRINKTITYYYQVIAENKPCGSSSDPSEHKSVVVRGEKPGLLQVSPNTDFSFVGTQHGPFNEPTSTTYELKNVGESSINWKATLATLDGSDWLTLSNAQGPLGAGESRQIDVSINMPVAKELQPDSYDATVTFWDETNNTTVKRYVYLTVIQGEQETYELTINISPPEGGLVEIDGSQYANGDKISIDSDQTVKLIAKESDGFQFVHWKGSVKNPPNEDAQVEIYMNSPKIVTAYFEEVKTEPVFESIKIGGNSVSNGDRIDVELDIENGEGFIVEAVVRNAGAADSPGDHNNITFSFPRFQDDTSDKERVDEHYYIHPKMEPFKYLGYEPSINQTYEYLLVEARTKQIESWPSGETRGMAVKVFPKTTGAFEVYVRAGMSTKTDWDDGWMHNPTYGHTDCTDHFVKVITVNVKSINAPDVEISEVQVWVYPGGPNIDPNYNPFCTRTNEGTRYCLPIAMTRYELGDDVVDDIAVIVKIKNRSSVRIDESLKLKVHLKLFKPGDEDSALEYESSYLQIDPYATTGPLFMNMDKIEEIFKYSSGVEIRAYLTWNDEESTIFTADYLNDRRNRFEKTKYIFSGWDYSLGGLKDNWWPAENLRSKYLLYTFPDKQHFDNFLTKYGLMTPLQEMCEYAMDCLEDIAIAYANETTKGLWGDFLDGVNRNVDPEELEKKLDNIAGEIAGAVSGLGEYKDAIESIHKGIDCLNNRDKKYGKFLAFQGKVNEIISGCEEGSANEKEALKCVRDKLIPEEGKIIEKAIDTAKHVSGEITNKEEQNVTVVVNSSPTNSVEAQYLQDLLTAIYSAENMFVNDYSNNCDIFLTIYRPDGEVYDAITVSSLNEVITIPDAQEGIWNFELSTNCDEAQRCSLEIVKEGPDFVFSPGLLPYTNYILPGDECSYTVSLLSLDDFSSPVYLELEVVPTPSQGEITPTILPNPLTPTGASILKIETSPDTTPNVYKLYFTGTSGDKSHEARALLFVSDNDALPDTWEYEWFYDLDESPEGDFDGDGLPNLDEYELNTIPTLADTDFDRLPDGWEVQYDLNPLDPADADEDMDGDGFTNVEEYWAGTDPTVFNAHQWYVDGTVGSSGNGTNWEKAFKTIQEAVAAASEGNEIWVKSVADGYPLTSTINVNMAVAIYGGFSGIEDERSERDWYTNVTIIDGQNLVGCFSVGADATLDGFTITNGSAQNGGGIYIHNCSPTITNCIVTENSAQIAGGGISNDSAFPTITNSIFFGNSAGNGGGIENYDLSSPIITNCTFSGNSAEFGGGIFNSDSSPTITNCILWGDTAPNYPEICNWPASPTVTYCDIQGVVYVGEGNINADPLFVDPVNGDFAVQPGSPCIEAGTNTALELPSTDFEGDQRIIDGDYDGTATVDMGVDEYVPSVDTDADGLPDDWEMAYFGNLNEGPDDDYDGDGLDNLAEYQHGTDPTKADTDDDGLTDSEEIGANLTIDGTGDDLLSNLIISDPQGDTETPEHGSDIEAVYATISVDKYGEKNLYLALTTWDDTYNPDIWYEIYFWPAYEIFRFESGSAYLMLAEGGQIPVEASFKHHLEVKIPVDLIENDPLMIQAITRYDITGQIPNADVTAEAPLELEPTSYITDPTNFDTDSDHMPDGWEVYYGLNPLNDADANEDPDGDGLTNLQEYDRGTNPREYTDNFSPDKPDLYLPGDGEIEVSLTPTLETNEFYDPDGDNHAATDWQISTDEANFSDNLVLDVSCDTHLTSLMVPEFILNVETTYYWQVRFHDDRDAKSEWSEVSSFTTIDALASDDTDQNGVPDEQEITDPEVDLDEDQNPDMSQADMKCANTVVGDGQIAVKQGTNVSSVDSIRSIDPATIADTHNKPDEMPLGLISFRLSVDNPGDTAEVTVYLSEPAPTDAKWYKYDPVNGWQDYSAHAPFTTTHSVTLELQDGGFGDADGIANATIIDPSGLGTSATPPAPPPPAEGGGGGGGGCFIATTLHNLWTALHMSPRLTLVLVILLLGLVGFGAGIAVKHKRARRKI